jgi:hypothetical protein
MKIFVRIMVVFLTLSLSWVSAKNGFNIENSSIPVDLIRQGGPPKDGIPAINQPVFERAADASWLNKDDRVLGLKLNGQSKAYPIAILNWHELVNDQVGGQDVVVSFCPLCGTGMVFDAQGKEGKRTFGVSGLLFESDVLLYDQESDSLWSQLWMEAIAGPEKGTQLTLLTVDHTSWGDWVSRNPLTQVLSRETGYERDYSRNPYKNYGTSPSLYFPVQQTNDEFPVKSWVMGIHLKGETKAYPFELLTQTTGTIVDSFAGEKIKIEFDEVHQVARAFLGTQQLPTVQAYWFAWYAFYPETQVFELPK